MQAVQTVWASKLGRFAAQTPDGHLVLFVKNERKATIRGQLLYKVDGMVPNEAELKKAVEYNFIFQTYNDQPDLEHTPVFEQLEELARKQ